MTITNFPPLSEFGVNSYLITSDKGGSVLIDAPYGGEYILKQIEEKNIRLEKILLTHGHCDHIATAFLISQKTGAKVYIHSADRNKLTDNSLNLSEYFALPPIDGITDPVTVEDGDIITQDELEIEVMNTPGHTSGSVCYIIDDHMFCGDTLFKGSMGRTDMPDGDEATMLQTLAMLYDFDTSTDYKLYSGHGEQSSLSAERANNPYLKYAHSKAR